jgi:hypothetical protein
MNKELYKCDVEGCNNPTSRYLKVKDDITLKEIFVCVSHWEEIRQNRLEVNL